MGRWTDIAEWVGPTTNEGDGDGRPGEAADSAVECRGAVGHIAVGYYLGTISWQRDPAADVSSHFVVAGPRDSEWNIPDGKIGQVVDTDVWAWTQQAGNGHWISIEFSGFLGDALSPAQIESGARILSKGHQVYGYPLQIATNPNGRGLGHHSMGTNGRSVPTDTWTGPTWGHEDCPGPLIVAQKPAILARAQQIVSGATTQPNDDRKDATMPRIVQVPTGQYLIGEQFITPIHDPTASAALQAVWGPAVLVTARQLEIAQQFIPAAPAVTAPAPVALTADDRAAIVADLLTTVRSEIRDAVADLGEGGAAQVRADAAS